MDYVVIGASAAGINAISTLRRLDEKAKITLISTDEYIYSRCILHHYLEGIRDIKTLDFTEDNFIEKNKVKWIKGVSLKKIDSQKQALTLSNRTTVTYDKLLLATGASSYFPPIKSLNHAKNVLGLRNLDDAISIKSKVKLAQHIVVMGAGLVGIDAITGLLPFKKHLTLVEFKGHMLSQQLDKKAAAIYQEAFADKGVVQYYNTSVEEIITDAEGAITKIKLSTGKTIPCDLLIVAAGVRSNIDFLKGSGIEFDKFGLIFNEYGETNIPNVYGAGDISGRTPIWSAAVKEGIVAASNMMGNKRELTDFFASKSTMNFLNIATLALGRPEPEDDTYQVEIREDELGHYKKIIHKDGVIYGAIIQGDLSYAGVLTQLIKEKIRIDKIKKAVFDINYSDFFYQTKDLHFKY